MCGMRTTHRAIRATRCTIVLATVIFSLVGCAFNYIGRTVLEEDRIVLNEGSHAGVWSALDVRVPYRYALQGNNLRISGAVEFESRITFNFTTIKYFHLSVMFLDNEGRVISSVGIISSAYSYPKYHIPFNSRIHLPPGTAYLSFSYNGEALGSFRDGSGPTSFWYYPLQ
jgi:hypothetical protein